MIARRIAVVIAIVFSGLDALLGLNANGGPVMGDCFGPSCYSHDYVDRFAQAHTADGIVGVAVVICAVFLWNGSAIAATCVLAAVTVDAVLGWILFPAALAGILVLQAPAVLVAVAILLERLTRRWA